MIKKATIIGLAAFYLLLTSGLFVCAVHCTTSTLFAKPGMQMAGMRVQHSKNCMTSKNCDCCRKHSSFIVKENLKPGYSIDLDQKVFDLQKVLVAEVNSYPVFYITLPVLYGKAPPGTSGKALSIKLHSLLI